MKGFKIKSILVSMFLLLGGCSTTPMHSNQSLSSEVGTGWGGDVKSTVTGVSAERAEREPSEIILINYSAKYQPGYDRVYSIRISNLEYAVRDATLTLFQSLVVMTPTLDSGNILSQRPWG